MATNYKTNGKESSRGISGYASTPREAKGNSRQVSKKANIEVKKKSAAPAPKSYGGKSSSMVGITRGIGYKNK